MLDLRVMVYISDIAGKIILNGIDVDTVFLDHSLVDDVVGEFDPLEIFVSIDINLLE